MDPDGNWIKMDTLEKLSADLGMTIKELEIQLALGSLQTANTTLLDRFTLSSTSLRVHKHSGLCCCLQNLAVHLIMPRTEVVRYTHYGSHTVQLEIGGLAERIKKNGKGRIHYVITPTGEEAAKIIAAAELRKNKLINIPVKINVARYYHYMLCKGR